MTSGFNEFFVMAEEGGKNTDPYNQGRSKPAVTGSQSGLVSTDRSTKVVGRSIPSHDTRLVPFPWAEVKDTRAHFEVSKDDRMSPTEARDALVRLMEACGVDKSSVGIRAGFLDALLWNHTINSGSVLQPGRSTIQVAGMVPVQTLTIAQLLGNDYRRFFRAFADETRRVNNQVISDYASLDDAVSRDKYQVLIQVARSRDLMRYPDLAHDSAECCYDLTTEQGLALRLSKASVLSAAPNIADLFVGNVDADKGVEGIYGAAQRKGGVRG